MVRSKNAEFKEGVHVYGFFSAYARSSSTFVSISSPSPHAIHLGHQAYSVYPNKADLIIIENKEGLPWSYYVGVTGMPGKTAYHAWKEYSRAKEVRHSAPIPPYH